MFLFLFFMTGAVYGGLYSIALMFLKFKDFKKEFKVQINNYKNLFFVSLIGILFAVIVVFSRRLIMLRL